MEDKEIEGMEGLYKILPIKYKEIIAGEKIFIIKDKKEIDIVGGKENGFNR